MADNQRAELLAVIAELSGRYPHWRIGQLIAHVAGWADRGVWDIEDDELHAAAQAHLENLRRESSRIPQIP